LHTERRMELFAHVLPQASLLHLETWHLDTTTAQVTLQVQSMQTLVPCPVCRFPTRRIHRRDGRPVADLPWAPWRVVLHLQVRKFCCAKGRCSRRIFTERRPGVVAPWARRTARRLEWLAQIAVARGGAAGVQLSRGLGVAGSRRTPLRVLRRLPLPSVRGSRAPPPVRWRPGDASPPGGMRTMRRSKLASPCPGARVPSRGTAIVSKCFNARCVGARTSIS
jgi:hypothetical protein